MIGLPAGIHDAVPADEYHSDPAPEPSFSNSIMRVLLTQAPIHAWLRHPRLNVDWQPEEDRDTFDLGTVAHALMLEGLNKATLIAAKDWRTGAAKEARQDAREAGLIPMLPGQYETAIDMVTAAHAYIEGTSLRHIWSRGKPEQTLIWQQRGVWCRGRLDFLSAERQLIVDYKTTAARTQAEFIRKMPDHGYDTQSVFYPAGLAACGFPGARFLFLVQETRRPFLCYLVEPAASMIELATLKIARALPLWASCLKSNSWPGYSGEVIQAEATPWAIQQEAFES